MPSQACLFQMFPRYILSCGKDSSVKLWEVGTGRLVKQYLGATHTQLRCQVCQAHTACFEEFIFHVTVIYFIYSKVAYYELSTACH